MRGDPSNLEGEVSVDGSNTLLPHGAALAEEFQWRNNRVRIPVRGSGTGAGFQRFCAGETDVQNASRGVLGPEDVSGDQISEIDQCANNNVEWVEFEAARDGIAVFVNPDNWWCDTLTVDELRRIWEPGSEVETWADVRPDDEDFPDEEIDLYGRDSGSGTFDFYTKAINDGIGRIRSDYSATADTNVIVRGVRGSTHGLGWGGAGYFYENEEQLKLVAVDDDNGGVTPTQETIETDSYTPLTRDMYVYFNVDEFEREEVREFARFYFSEIDDRARDAQRSDGERVVGPDETLRWTQWAARMVRYYATPDDMTRENAEKLDELLEEYE